MGCSCDTLYYESEGERMYVNDSQVVTLAEALARIGFPIHNLDVREYTREHASETFVSFPKEQPSVMLRAGGHPWSFCSGAMLFSFCAVRKDSSGKWYEINQGYAVVCDIKETKHTNPPGYAVQEWVSHEVVFKLVEPA
jgi:hypothetical protein